MAESSHGGSAPMRRRSCTRRSAIAITARAANRSQPSAIEAMGTDWEIVRREGVDAAGASWCANSIAEAAFEPVTAGAAATSRLVRADAERAAEGSRIVADGCTGSGCAAAAATAGAAPTC
jgi:hypothetical protein